MVFISGLTENETNIIIDFLNKTKEREIVLVNQDSGYLMIDIANAYVDNGFSVSLITGRLVQRNIPLHYSIKISKIICYDRSSTFKRVFTWSLATLQILFLIWFKYRNKHLMIVSNPPFAPLIPLVVKNRFSLLIYDVYPNALVEYNILKEKSFLIRKWKESNRIIFKKALKIFTISEGMKNVLTQYVEPNKIKVIPIWTDNTFLKPIAKENNPFIIEQGLEDKFIIMYSGNLGKTHNIEVMIELAEELSEQPYFFIIIGGGEQYGSIKKIIEYKELKNIMLLPWQPTEILPFTLAAADIGVVSLGLEASNLSIPSKTYNLMSVGIPILSIADPNSELAKLVESKELGKNFKNNQISEMKNFIKLLNKDKVKMDLYIESSLLSSKSFDPKNAYKFID